MRGPVVLLVADEYYASLAAVRALAAGGYAPYVGSIAADGFAQRSRAAAGVAHLPDPSDGDTFVAAVADTARRIGAAAVLPGSEAALLALCDRDDQMPSGVALGAPPLHVVLRAGDKRELAEHAAAVGLMSPAAAVVQSGETDALESVAYPAVLKPVASAVRSGDGTVALPHAVEVAGAADVRKEIERHAATSWLVQPFIAGRLVAVAGVAWHGRVVVSVHQEAERIFPPHCGVSAFARTVDADSWLDGRLAALNERLESHGIWEAQFIATGSGHYLIDFNPRIYGSLALAVAAGANLPAVWVDLLLGREPRRTQPQVGVHFRAEPRELGLLAAAVAERDVRAALDVLRPRRRTAHAVLSLRDPGPARLLVKRAIARSRRAETV